MPAAVSVVRFPVELPDGLAERAREELLGRGGSPPGAAFRFGYLLGVELDELASLPAVARLERFLREHVVEPGYALSFLKTTTGAAPEAEEGVHFDGFHLDTHPEIRRDEDGVELARLLINLAPTPRAFRYAAADRFELGRRGLPVPRSDYQVVELPPDVPIEVIEIPPLEPSGVHALAFWASVVPHVGMDGPDGHFLASYEAVRDPFKGSIGKHQGGDFVPSEALPNLAIPELREDGQWTRSSRRSPRGASGRLTVR
jgi:hypothetical protein